MRILLFFACCLLATGVYSKSIPGSVTGAKRQAVCQDPCQDPCTNPCTRPGPDESDDDDDDEPKRLVVYFNFEKVMKHGRISDKSGYENSGTMQQGGEILKFNDADYTCNQAARLWDHDVYLRGDTFQAKPKAAITIAAWIKLEEKTGQHSIFDTIGTSHQQGQFHFEVNDGVVRWFHRDQSQKVVFETMAHSVPKGKWAHVAGTYDSKTKQAKIFINGEIRNQSIGEGQLSRDWGVRAGIGNKEKGRPLRGSIDEFRIYNYALKIDEIKALVTACKAGGGGGGGGGGGDSGGAAPASARTLVPTDTKSATVPTDTKSTTADKKTEVDKNDAAKDKSDTTGDKKDKTETKEEAPKDESPKDETKSGLKK